LGEPIDYFDVVMPGLEDLPLDNVRKRDGSPVEVNQVPARTGNYPDLFEKEGSRIRLKGEPR
jgi:hypothetical protein